MLIETRRWSAVLLIGTTPRLIVEGEARTHPYAFVSLSERRVFGSASGTLCLDIRVVGDRPGLDVLAWKPIHFERVVRDGPCETVVIGGTGVPIRLEVKRVAAHVYARNGHR
jgi:hypothetical protein